MKAVRRIQLGDRRSLISISPSDLIRGKTLEDREKFTIEYIFIRADGVGAEDLQWFITDGEDYKQKFTINQLENEDGLAEDMPNIWRVSNYGVPTVVTAMVRFDRPYQMKRLNIVVSLAGATIPFNVAYEVMCIKELDQSDADQVAQPVDQQVEAAAVEAFVPQATGEGVYVGLPAQPGEYEVPLAIPKHTADVIVQREHVPLPITDVQQSLHPIDIVRNRNIRQQTTPVEGETDRYEVVPSNQPIRRPPRTDPETAPSFKQPYSYSEVPLAPPPPKRRRLR